MSSIFPSISIKRKPKGQPSSGPVNQPGSSHSPSQIFRPLTPEATHKVISGDKVSESQSKSFNDQPLTTSSLNPKDNEVDTSNLDNITSTSSAASEPKRSPRPQSRSGQSHHESTSFHDRSGSVNSETSLYSELIEAPMVDQQDIIALTYHVRAFSEALAALKNTFFEFSETPDDNPPEVKAHERLGEVLSILKGVLNQYQPLHSTDILAAAGTLINKVKSHNYDESDKAPEEFCESVDQLALAFSSSVSDFLMGDQDMPMSASRENSRSLEDFPDDDEDDDLDQEDDERTYEEEDLDDDQGDEDYRDDRRGSDKRETYIDKSAQKADELDKRLFGLEHGVDLALQRTKVWSKYAKDIATYLERRAHIEQEFTNKLKRLAQATRAAITEERYLPFQSIYVTSLDQDIEFAENCTKTYKSLLTSKFLEPLQSRRTYHERKRKELKETWTKSYKKLNDAIAKLERAKQTYFLKQQEIEKFKSMSDSKDGQEMSASFNRTQKKKQEDLRKADEAEEFFKLCVSEANVRQRELMTTKSHVLVELRQLIYQCDQTMKAVTCNFFNMMDVQSTPAPIRFQCLAESSRSYEPGSQFSDFVYSHLTSSQPTVDRVFAFEPYQPTNAGRLYQYEKHMSDAESTGSKSAPVTPEGSPVPPRRSHPPLDVDSSDDESFSERESRKPRNATGPFQNCRMSKAAQTHKFKKLRSPSKCRDCESYVYFNGAECANCGLTCHRKCLARIKNRCDRKTDGTGYRGSNYNVGRRMTTFGVDFNSHLRATNKHGEYVPYIVSLCVDEINSRGLQYKGIYRVCGVKSKVEKVCQVFENSSGVIDLSIIQPHVIAAVLKLYLRQLPEPLLTFKLYPEFVRVAKESLDKSQNASQNEGVRPVNEDILRKLREVVVKLPKANFKTAAKIISHLKLVADNKEENQMSACNLGIVFGPTLLRPRESASSDSVSMPALVDMAHQTKAVELLINNPEVFDEPGEDDPASQETPVEEFSSLERDKNYNEVTNVCSTRGKDVKAYPILVTTDDRSSDIPRDDQDHHDNHHENLVQTVEPVDLITRGSRNKLGSQITPVPRAASPSSLKSGLGFENEFFDLLVKSNEGTENEKAQQYSMPEFLLSGTTEERENDDDDDDDDDDKDVDDDDDKDVDDSYDDSTQGTSGSRTPDELSSSRGSLGRDGFIPKTDSLIDDSPVNQSESRGLMPTSTSLSDMASVSFGSDTQPDSILPDLSESYESEPNKPEKMENVLGYQGDEIPTKSVDDLSVPSPSRPRPGSLGLLKRNSDLPGMMSRFGFFPIGSKTWESSAPKEHAKKSAEPASTSGSKKHPGISDALREMHVVYDPLIANADKLRPNNQASTVEEFQQPVVMDTPISDNLLRDEDSKDNDSESGNKKEWYMSEQEEIHGMDTKEYKIEYQSPNQMEDIPSEEQSPKSSTPIQPELEVPEKNVEVDIRPKSPPPPFVEKKRKYKVIDTEGNFNEKTRNPARVSVKDRLRQYEQSPERTEGARKSPSPVSMIDISSRKQVFEKESKKESFKTLQDISKQAKNSSTSQDNQNTLNSREIAEPDASLENLKSEKSESHKQKETMSRKVDIPLDLAELEGEHLHIQERKKILLTSTNSLPLRTSPKQSRRSPRRQFPEDTSKEDREPQFV